MRTCRRRLVLVFENLPAPAHSNTRTCRRRLILVFGLRTQERADTVTCRRQFLLVLCRTQEGAGSVVPGGVLDGVSGVALGAVLSGAVDGVWGGVLGGALGGVLEGAPAPGGVLESALSGALDGVLGAVLSWILLYFTPDRHKIGYFSVATDSILANFGAESTFVSDSSVLKSMST